MGREHDEKRFEQKGGLKPQRVIMNMGSSTRPGANVADQDAAERLREEGERRIYQGRCMVHAANRLNDLMKFEAANGPIEDLADEITKGRFGPIPEKAVA